jgi:Mlc titration factor MtfA (ptsG expression regulator)
MFALAAALKRRWVLGRHELADREWEEALAAAPAAAHLDANQRGRLRELVVLFLREKALHGVQGVEVDAAARLKVALHACIPVLELGLERYSGWHSVLVYPGEFRTRHTYVDEVGVVHELDRVLAGEAWEDGPVVLSLEDIEQAGREPGYNVLLHELAHKLDMQNGVANGMPPLHRGMDRRAWTDAFSAAYADLCARVDAGEETAIDPYAAEDPAEFFAVLSELFFELPAVLDQAYPSVYAQLALYYRQDPLSRDGGG